MGRPPIGKVAMTGAERTRLYRLKQAKDRPVTKQDKPVTKQAGPDYAALEKELTRARARIAELEARKAVIDPATFSMTAQQKLDAAIRQHQQKLGSQFQQIVRDEVKKRMDEIFLPDLKKKIDQAQELYARRRGLMDKATFNKIRRALHPDSRNSISDRMLAEAFDTFMGLEKFLLDEKDSPTEFPDNLPRTWADWEKAKQEATAERRAKRVGRHSAVRPR